MDAAPLIVARELGFFSEEGLDVTLDRQIGWGNVRDKLSFGQLDASHAVLGLPLAGELTRERERGQSLISVMGLSSGGNAITLSRRLADAGVVSAAALSDWVKDRRSLTPITLAHVFSCSMHHYLLRDWLASGGINPDSEVRLCVIPPPMMPRHLKTGHLDGYCVGEPWNTLAAREGDGSITAATVDIVPEHPEKILAVSREWALARPSAVVGLVRAVLRGCVYCQERSNASALAAMLAPPRYLGVGREVLAESLMADESFGTASRRVRPPGWKLRSFSPQAMFPSATHVLWIASQMIRWGHMPSSIDTVAIAETCTDSSFFREAAASLGVECPATDFPSMRLRHGSFEAPRLAAAAT